MVQKGKKPAGGPLFAGAVPRLREVQRAHHRFDGHAPAFLPRLGWLLTQVQRLAARAALRGEMGLRPHPLNVSRGVSIWVNKRMWKPPRNVVKTYDGPSKLQGTAGAIRLRSWQEDVTAIVMYWPPKPKDAASRAAHAQTMQDTPKRSTPHIMTDLNDRMVSPQTPKTTP